MELFLILTTPEIAASDSPFEKIEIFLPLSILKSNIIFVDTPGLNEGEARNKITNRYLDNASAIIVLLDCSKPLLRNEQDLIKDLCSNRFSPPIIVFNKFDGLDNRSAEKLKRFVNAKLSPIPNASPDSAIYLSSLHALRAKVHKDSDLLQKSGFIEFEASLSDLLAKSRGERVFQYSQQLLSYIQDEVLDGFIIQQLRDLSSSKADFQVRFDDFNIARAPLVAQINSLGNRLEIVLEDALNDSDVVFSKFLNDIVQDTPRFIMDMKLSESFSQSLNDETKQKLFIEINNAFDSWVLQRYHTWLSVVWSKTHDVFLSKTKELVREANKIYRKMVAIQQIGTVHSRPKSKVSTSFGLRDAALGGVIFGSIACVVVEFLPGLVIIPIYCFASWILGSSQAEKDFRNEAVKTILKNFHDSFPTRISEFLSKLSAKFHHEHQYVMKKLAIKLDEIVREFEENRNIFKSDFASIATQKKMLKEFRISILQFQENLKLFISQLEIQ